MKHLLLCLMLLTAASTSSAQEAPKYEMRNTWIPSVFNLDWPQVRDNVTLQKSSLITILDNLKAAGINAVLLQVRNECDALYDSPYEPWSYYLTGLQGKAPEPFWDPLAFAVEEAHKRGIELHAWLNPYRAESTVSQHAPLDPEHIIFQKPEWILQFPRSETQDFKMLNPGIPDVWEYVTKIVMDVVTRYDVDGIQFDDYFYPYPVGGRLPNGIRLSDDQATFDEYNRGFTNRAEWRRDNVNRMLEMVHDSIKAVKPWVKFGISPFGIHRNGTPPGITGLDAHNVIYTDAPKWVEDEYVDYLAPQLYWDFGGGQDFGRLAPWWAGQLAGRRHLYVGHAVYRAFPATNIGRQIRLTRAEEHIQGSIFYSSKYIWGPNNLRYADTLRTYYYTKPALAPPMPWNNPDSRPGQPVLVTVQSSLTGPVLTWIEPGWQTIRNPFYESAPMLQIPNKEFVIYRYEEGETFDINSSKHLLAVVPRTQLSFNDRTGQNGVRYNYVVTTVDRAGIEGEPASAVSIVWTNDEDQVAQVPHEYELKQNYPNPFNPSTMIEFSLPSDQRVLLEVYNLIGQRVALLKDGMMTAGTHRVDFDASRLGSGVYLYRLSAGSRVLTNKMTLIK